MREVPEPSKRIKLALNTHRGMGHFGVQRVIDRLQKNYHWRGSRWWRLCGPVSLVRE